jgi:uncharacterized protein with LGFP repeats
MRSIHAASLCTAGAGIVGLAAMAAWGVHTLPYRAQAAGALPSPSPQLRPVPLPDLARRSFDRRPAPYGAPRPEIVTRAQWGANESLREEAPRYGHAVRVVFLHHTDNGNGYDCGQVPEIIRGIYTGHVKDHHWDDVAYNFFVDRCGTIYEGRAGGVARPVTGAQAVGFNTDTMGIAAVGTYDATGTVTQAMTDAIAQLSAWKLGLTGVDPRGTQKLRSTNAESRFRKGSIEEFHAISGHRDSFFTDCPGDDLYGKLRAIRAEAARLQGR